MNLVYGNGEGKEGSFVRGLRVRFKNLKTGDLTH
jgi:hypothetical protein